jgi:5-methylcytosine-specific restriction endonuclease McrA
MTTKYKFKPEKRAELMRQLADGEGWRCHYCHKPLVPHGEEEAYCASRFEPHGKTGELIKIYSIPQGYSSPYLDHKVPQHLGGTHEIENLVLACDVCNSKKSYRHTYEEFYALTAPLRSKA